MSKKQRCIHPDCRFRNIPSSDNTTLQVSNGCNYMLVTGKSRIAQLPPDLRDPARCPLYDPGGNVKPKPVFNVRPPRPRVPREWEAKALELYKSGHNDIQIADMLGIKSHNVADFRRRRGLPRVKQTFHRFTFNQDKAMELYRSGRSDKEIGDAVCVSRSTIGKWRQDRGLEANTNIYIPQTKIDWSQAQQLYEQGHTDKEIADALGCCPQYVGKWRSRRGLPVHAAVRPSFVQRIDWDSAYSMYAKGLTDKQIAAELGCSDRSVHHWRKKNCLPSKHKIIKKEKQHEQS